MLIPHRLVLLAFLALTTGDDRDADRLNWHQLVTFPPGWGEETSTTEEDRQEAVDIPVVSVKKGGLEIAYLALEIIGSILGILALGASAYALIRRIRLGEPQERRVAIHNLFLLAIEIVRRFQARRRPAEGP